MTRRNKEVKAASTNSVHSAHRRRQAKRCRQRGQENSHAGANHRYKRHLRGELEALS